MSGRTLRVVRLALVAALLLAACDEPRHEQGLALAAGDSLLEHLDELAVVGHPGTSLTPELAERVRAAGPEPAWSLPAAA